MKPIEEIDFWKWAFSDLLSNELRGVLAEYIVASAVGCTHRPRTEWDAYDLETDDGLKIEIKSSAYLQSWTQKSHSTIRFDIAPKMGWTAATNTIATEASRAADVYVFCIFTTKERAVANPRDLSQWSFLVCRTQLLNEKFGNQKSVGLSSLIAIGLEQLSFRELGSLLQRNHERTHPQ